MSRTFFVISLTELAFLFFIPIVIGIHFSLKNNFFEDEHRSQNVIVASNSKYSFFPNKSLDNFGLSIPDNIISNLKLKLRMKKSLLTIFAFIVCVGSQAQNASRLPQGFRKAEIPASAKSKKITVDVRESNKDAGTPFNKTINSRLTNPQPSTPTLGGSFIDEYLVGYSFYDLQTNNAISNRIVHNDDGSYAVSWTYSPNYDAAEAFPDRGTGYNYSPDGISWIYPYVPGSSQGPGTRVENIRTGFTNIVNTSSGSEMVIAHSADAMGLTYRPAKGTGAWNATTFPWGPTTDDTWSKAIAGGNDMVYAIFQGSGVSTTSVLGQKGPLFFSRSTDGGVTWSTKAQIPGTDSTEYMGFGGDEYSIDARGNTVAIALGSTITDLMLLKSTDAGLTWTKKLIYISPLPMFNTGNGQTSDTNSDGIPDTLLATGGDAAVLIDENDLCHVVFSDVRWMSDGATAGSYSYFPGTDGLEYWNENMATGGYVFIAAAEDFNGNGVLDVPEDQTCSFQWGNYGGGITGLPSLGLGDNNTIYLSYQTINELADTAQYHQAHRHVYIMTSPDHGQTWTYPYNIVPTIAQGGDGENQEAVFAALPKSISGNILPVLYQRDGAPGHALALAGTCDDDFNSVNSSDIVFGRYDIAAVVGVPTVNENDLFITQAYPNPTTGMAYFNVSTKTKADLSVTVTDLLGKVVYSEQRNNVAAGVTTISLNTGSWTSGLYNYNVISGDQKVSRRIVVQ